MRREAADGLKLLVAFVVVMWFCVALGPTARALGDFTPWPDEATILFILLGVLMMTWAIDRIILWARR